jgi:hypothetical protein
MAKFNNCYNEHFKGVDNNLNEQERKIIDDYVERIKDSKNNKEAQQYIKDLKKELNNQVNKEAKTVKDTVEKAKFNINEIENDIKLLNIKGKNIEEALIMKFAGNSKMKQGSKNSLANKVDQAAKFEVTELYKNLESVDNTAYKLLVDRDKSNPKFKQLDLNIREEYARFNKFDENGLMPHNKSITGDEIAYQMAKQKFDSMSTARKRFQKAGGDVRELDSYAGQVGANELKKGKYTFDQFYEKTVPLLNKDKYNVILGKSQGGGKRAMTEAEFKQSLKEYYNDKSNPTDQYKFNDPLTKAKRLEGSRFLHFKDVESQVKFNDIFNEGRSFLEDITNKLQNTVQQELIMHELGSHPKHTLTLMNSYFQEKGYQTGFSVENGVIKDLSDTKVAFNKPAVVINDILEGSNRNSYDNKLARMIRGSRAIAVTQTLGKFSWASAWFDGIKQNQTFNLYSNENNLTIPLRAVEGLFDSFGTFFNGVQKTFSKTGAESLRSDLIGLNYGYETIIKEMHRIPDVKTDTFIDRINSIFYKYSGAEAVNMSNDIMAVSKAKVLLGGIENIQGNKRLNQLLKVYDIDNIGNKLKLMVEKGKDGISTFDIDKIDILRQNGVSENEIFKVKNMYYSLLDEATSRPNYRTRSITNLGTKSNTATGEFVRNAMQYQSYVFQDWLSRVNQVIYNPAMSNLEKIGNVVMWGSVALMATYGYQATSDIIQGKTPRKLWEYKNGVFKPKWDTIQGMIDYAGILPPLTDKITDLGKDIYKKPSAGTVFESLGKLGGGVVGSQIASVLSSSVKVGQGIISGNEKKEPLYNALSILKKVTPGNNTIGVELILNLILANTLSDGGLKKKLKNQEERYGNKPLF